MREGEGKKGRKKGRKEEREALRGFQEGDGKERVEISQDFLVIWICWILLSLSITHEAFQKKMGIRREEKPHLNISPHFPFPTFPSLPAHRLT